jgi:hypothetical protein
MKSITKLSLVLLTAMAFAAFPANAQDAAPTNNAPAARPARPPRVIGAITAIDASAMTITVKSTRDGDVTVKVTSDTKITKDREPAVFADAKEGLRATVTGEKQSDGSWIAKTLSISTRVRRTPPPTAAPATPPADQK